MKCIFLERILFKSTEKENYKFWQKPYSINIIYNDHRRKKKVYVVTRNSRRIEDKNYASSEEAKLELDSLLIL